jgi:hypothetical protein
MMRASLADDDDSVFAELLEVARADCAFLQCQPTNDWEADR